MYGTVVEFIAFSLPSVEILIAAGLIMLFVGFLTWALVARKDPAEAEIHRRLDGLPGEPKQQHDAETVFRGQVGGTLANKLAVFGKPLETPATYDRNQLALSLSQAGVRNDNAVHVFLSAKMLLVVVGAMIGLGYSWLAELSSLNMSSAIMFGAVLGFYLPNIWLRRAVARRSERIAFALPDSLDMLVIAVEAGLGLDGAIQRVADEMNRTYPDLAEEWTIAARETQMGIPRAEAMRKMADRSKVPEMHSLVAILVQAERLGTGIAQTLRVHAETMRVRRRQMAEERAAKTTVKLLFPLIFFLFPTIFVVIMGPAAITYFNLTQ